MRHADTVIVPTDPDYQRAKQAKQGRRRLDPRFNAFADEFARQETFQRDYAGN